mmetsp:Transcript_52700/g.98866  ORF Transcript_52700/g.98866 Transcript_52700/m.98866 type:complete len:99 (-) Transcript_52700:92-388(-)
MRILSVVSTGASDSGSPMGSSTSTSRLGSDAGSLLTLIAWTFLGCNGCWHVGSGQSTCELRQSSHTYITPCMQCEQFHNEVAGCVHTKQGSNFQGSDE